MDMTDREAIHPTMVAKTTDAAGTQNPAQVIRDLFALAMVIAGS
jgi:hypothetical protein